MGSRGERNFIHLPTLAAQLYTRLTSIRPVQQQHNEIAGLLCSRIDHGKLLDIGTGPGFLLQAIHRLNPAIQLYGPYILAQARFSDNWDCQHITPAGLPNWLCIILTKTRA